MTQLVSVAEAPKREAARDRRVVVNVGGSRHETFLSTLRCIPDTRLALLAHLQEADETWDPVTREFFFDRNPVAFGVIMQYLRTQELHVDHSICGNVLKPELAYWGVEEQDIEACCWAEYSKFTEHREALEDLDDNFHSNLPEGDCDEEMPCFQRFREGAWRFLEEPTSSKGAKVYAVLSMFFVVMSITIFVLETHKLFQVDEKTGTSMYVLEPEDDWVQTGRSSRCCCEEKNVTSSERMLYSPATHPVLKILDYICASFFLLEVIVRFLLAPDKVRFWKDFLNIIDFICLIPHFTAITLVALNQLNSSSLPIKTFMVLRVVRILRIFKLMKHYSAFKILVYTVKVSTKELTLMIVFLMSGVLMFASIIHYVEKHNFPNIPIAIWWAIVTMTTVGYGDKYPVEYGGYIVGCMCVISGVLVIAFTVPIVVNNFSLYYAHAQTRIKLPKRKRKRSGRTSRVGVAPTDHDDRSLSARSTATTASIPSSARSRGESEKHDNDLNINEAQPPPKEFGSKQVELTTHGEKATPVSTIPAVIAPLDPDPVFKEELHAQSVRLIKAMHSADEKMDRERRRQEFKLKMERAARTFREQAKKNDSMGRGGMDAKSSDVT